MDSMGQMIVLVLIVAAALAVLVARRKTLGKMALRNIVRKRKFTIIITAGLLIATAMISGSLVMADTLDYIIRQDTYESTGSVDIVVTAKDFTGKEVYFDEALALNLTSAIGAGATTYIDGVQPAIREGVSVMDEQTGIPFPMATLFALNLSLVLNPLLDETKSPVTVDDISDGKVVINEALADELNAKAGDSLIVITSAGTPQYVQISHIAYNTGAARWRNDYLVFMDLEYVQNFIRLQPHWINMIDVSNEGSITKGYKVTDQAVEELTGYLPTNLAFTFSTIKADGVETAETTSDMVSQLFVVMSSFTIIAGIALIVNIFVMLAEERKPEMGISRAIGMQRGDLTQAFTFEGVVYAVMAAIVGALVGLLIAGVMMGLFSRAFGGEMAFTLHFENQSLVIAGCAGFLITLLTVLAASWRVSKLNIVRAIRDIPEPALAKSGRQYFLTGVVGLVFGLLLLVDATSSKQAFEIDVGPSLILIGASLILVRYVNPRLPFTLTGLVMVVWILDPTNFKDYLFGDITSGLEMFIVSGTLLVIGGVLIAMFNSDLLIGALAKVAGKRRSLLPVFRTAISYPMNKKFRTGLTVFIFALIMFTVTVLAMIASFQRESVDATTQQFSGGFELVGMSIRDLPSATFEAGIQDLRDGGNIDRVEASLTAPISIILPDKEEPVSYSILGMTPNMLEDNKFSLADRADEFGSDEEAWRALTLNSSQVIIDGSVLPQMYGPSFGIFSVNVGDDLILVMSDGTQVQVKVIGIMDQFMNMAVYTSNDFILNNTNVVQRNLFYISTSKQGNMTDKEVADALESRFVEYGMRVYVARDTIETVMNMISSVMQLMEIFLGMGLVVGISGLGIITVRSVAERRQEIGVMRSIGFQRDMILKTFLLETSYVSLLGIIMGVVLGLLLSYKLWEVGGFEKNSPFVIPWGEILMLVAIAFLITLAATLPPARSASRLAPAEALRRVD